MDARLFAVMSIVLLLSGCASIDAAVPSLEPVGHSADLLAREVLPGEVAKLTPLNLSTVENFDRYVTFADSMNDLITILNEQSDIFNIPEFQTTQEAWEKASRLITEYGPLIDNYNGVVLAAQDYTRSTSNENLEEFYIQAGKFGIEASIIVGAVFYGAAYETVGIAYRAVGLNRLALSCGSCVSVILSQAHWTMRNALAEGTSELAEVILRKIAEWYG